MNTDNIERYLNSFGKQVVNRSKGNIQKAKGGGTKLEQSLGYEVDFDGDNYSLKFYMADYGTYVDKGVSGNKKVQKFKDYLGKVISSPYRYTTKQPPSGVLDKWVVRKGIAPRDEKGRFIKRKSLVFLIARKIKRDGIKSLSFFQKPLGLAFRQFGDKISEALGEDILDSLKTYKITVS
jgi:hypothetical protein|tara:strand:+ start:41 stop:577 length:537 start_codon:yes stop_codon:yes gene_type:complete